jgi:hypothetical protein
VRLIEIFDAELFELGSPANQIFVNDVEVTTHMMHMVEVSLTLNEKSYETVRSLGNC